MNAGNRNRPRPDLLLWSSALSLIALIFLCLLWELWLAPLRPGGSWLVLKTLPLLAPLFGILRGVRQTYVWAPLLILAYFVEGWVRLYAEPAPAAVLALIEIGLATIFFCSALAYLRSTRPPRTGAGS